MKPDDLILVVEDSEIQEVMLRRILLKHGFKVVSAKDGAAGLQKAEEHSPSLILSDVIMPVMDGYEMCRRIKSNPRLKGIPVLMLTEIEDPAGVLRGLESMADGYITKPYDADYLLQIIEKFLTPAEKSGSSEQGIVLDYAGRNYSIYPNPERILHFLLLTYEHALRQNAELARIMAERKSMHAVLLRQEKLASIGTLSAGVAHEILNPLNIIGTIVQLMQMDEQSPKVKENLDEIMAQINRATKITNNLRMFAHVHKREITAVDVHALFDKTATLMEHDLSLDNIMVDRDYDQNLPLIFADQDLLAQVLLNLINNARQALLEVKDGRKKLITIKTGAFPGKAEIRLSNNGPRIPENIIDKIFDPFFTTKDPNKGTGLGLSMAHTFIQDFGGSIAVQNEAPEGVTFIITLPTKGEENENTGR